MLLLNFNDLFIIQFAVKTSKIPSIFLIWFLLLRKKSLYFFTLKISPLSFHQYLTDLFSIHFVTIVCSIDKKSLYFIAISISHLHNLNAFVPCGYVVILSNVCNLLSSSLHIIKNFIDFCVYTLWWSLLNIFGDFNMVLSLN